METVFEFRNKASNKLCKAHAILDLMLGHMYSLMDQSYLNWPCKALTKRLRLDSSIEWMYILGAITKGSEVMVEAEFGGFWGLCPQQAMQGPCQRHGLAWVA